ncbi:hypothetical protein ATANTOWER_028316 [Ataeniobius toweri]|uniref:Uncharacterized protein n=1 Tax=Ataeniobius toweri TaxID=208326 RepID=A0ABU7AKY1_9TELE|nr:hypothetical protein [Ataeniobius toweri]
MSPINLATPPLPAAQAKPRNQNSGSKNGLHQAGETPPSPQHVGQSESGGINLGGHIVFYSGGVVPERSRGLEGGTPTRAQHSPHSPNQPNTPPGAIGHQKGAHHSGTWSEHPHSQHPTRAGTPLLGPSMVPSEILIQIARHQNHLFVVLYHTPDPSFQFYLMLC